MAENTTPLSMKSSDVYAEGEVSPSKAEHVMTTLTKGSVGVEYDGPGALEDKELVEPEDAVDVLNTALGYSSQMTPDEQLERRQLMEELGFDNSTYGSGSVVQELVEGHGKQGADTPVYLMAAFDEELADKESGIASEYAVVVDDLQTAVRSTQEDFEANLKFTGNMLGESTSQRDVQEYARTVGGELSEAYQTIADL
ncbi:MAG: hypothetical protein H8Z69_01340 [Nanohaloarchaea archaeon]|nr:hypothetical protein [Candidatus Nanohaloarchaea archaeon]